MSNSNVWEPHPGKQTEALSRSEDEILYGGARGGGKTDAGLAWMVEPEYSGNPLYKGLVIRKNYDDLSDWLARASVFYRGTGDIVGNPAVVKLKGGGFIRAGHLKDKDAYGKYLGHEYHKILIEEVTQIPDEDNYEKLLSTNRSTVPGLKPQCFLTTNPGGPGHSWVKGRFVDVAKMKTYFDPISGKSRIFIPSRVEDNPTLMKNDPSYVKFLEALPSRLRRAWREGDWDAFEGQFFSDFQQDVHIIKPFKIDPAWPLYGSLDPGWSSPCSFGLRAKDFNGNSYRIFTYYESEKSPSEHARAIMERITNCPYTKDVNGDPRMPQLIVSGHDAWARKDRFSIISHEMTWADIFSNAGLYLSRANTDRFNGWNAMKQMMRNNLDVDLNENRYYLFEGTNQPLIDEMIAVEGDDKNPDDIQGRGNDPGVNDHCLHGDTKIITKDGVFKIKDMVGKENYVLSLNDKYVPFTSCRLTQKNVDTVKVVFENGSSLICTPDHKILTSNNKMVCARDIKGLYCSITNLIKGETLWKLKLYHPRSKSLMEKDTISVGATSEIMENCYISPSGNITMARGRMGFMSTIKTTIDQIIRTTIYNLKKQANIFQIIQRGFQNHYQNKLTGRLKSGIRAKKDWNGTKNTITKTAKNRLEKGLVRYVINAIKNIWAIISNDFVLMLAKVGIGESKDLITYNQYVSSVNQILQKANTVKPKPALKNVLLNSSLKVVTVLPYKKSDVYCLEAENTHVFTLANGITVSNSLDEDRYNIMAQYTPMVYVAPEVKKVAPDIVCLDDLIKQDKREERKHADIREYWH